MSVMSSTVRRQRRGNLGRQGPHRVQLEVRAPGGHFRRRRSLVDLSHLRSSALLLAVLDLTVVFGRHVLAARLLAMVVVVLLPGTLVVSAARMSFAGCFESVAMALGAGTALLMTWAAIGSWLLPGVGVVRPLDTAPLLVAVNILIVVAASCCPRDEDPVLRFVPAVPLRARGAARASVLVAVPLLAVVGIERLNGGQGSALAQLAVGGVIATVLVGLCLAERLTPSQAQVLLFSAALAIIYLYSFRTSHLFGFDIQQEYQRFDSVFVSARWTPPTNGDPYASMLSITALPVVLSKLSGVSGIYLFKGLLPVFLALVPGLTFGFVRRWVPARAAFSGAAYLLVLAQFSGELSGISRQEVGLFFFAAVVVIIFSEGQFAGGRGWLRRQAVILYALAALVVSHYSTSYVTVALLAGTWVGYGMLRMGRRALRRPRLARPAVGLVTVVGAIALVLGWDVVITRSTANVTNFVSSAIDKGPNFLPNSAGGSIFTRWLSGNVTPAQTASGYYAQAATASSKVQPWLNAYPRTLTARYPAQVAAPYPAGSLHVPLIGALSTDLQVAVSEAFLALMVVGVAVTLVRWRRRRGGGVPLEVAVLGGGFLAFVAAIRISGTVAGSYNQERAQLQAGVVLAVGLGVVLAWVLGRFGRLCVIAVGVALSFMVLLSTGLVGELSGGKSVLTADTGRAYDQFFITDQEVAASRWLVSQGGPHALIWTDEYGELRIWSGTAHAAATQTDLTPATIDQGAWVYATGYNVEGRAYGSSSGGSAEYEFPAAFLDRAKSLVYSSPGAQVYR